VSDAGRPGANRLVIGRLLLAVLWAPVAVLATHVVLDLGLQAYDRRPWLDGPMHVAGGAAIAHGIGAALRARDDRGHPLAPILMVTGTAAVAVLWEFCEFTIDRLFGTNLQVSLPNTMKDLALGLLGGVVLAISPAIRDAVARRR
jgi:hypothetical protein